MTVSWTTAYIWFSIFFILGILFRLFQRAASAKRSGVNTYPTMWSFVVAHWDTFLIRTVIFNTGSFILWLNHPDLPAKALEFVHVPVWIASWVPVVPGLGSSAGFGYFVDIFWDQFQFAFLAKFPGLPDFIKGELPSYDAAVVKTEDLDPTRKVGEAGPAKN